VVLSLGVRQASVPNLAGKAMSAAQVTVQSEGLELGDTLSIASSAGEPGTIVGQDPPPGASVAAGTRIDLLVALDAPSDIFVMPDLVYRRYEPVRGYFEGGGFRMGAVKFEPYEGFRTGRSCARIRCRVTPPQAGCDLAGRRCLPGSRAVIEIAPSLLAADLADLAGAARICAAGGPTSCTSTSWTATSCPT